jgi:class 3 adenylate cyclase/tetratricopeptide (TPR) repeat protein
MRWFARREQRAGRGSAAEAAGGARCANCGALNPAGARFCNQCGQRLTITGALAGTTPPADAHVEISEERRVVTILFADLANSTALADALDAEELRALLARFFALMAEEIHWHGGIVEKFIGDAVMGIFGLPQIHEDDPVRAVRAGLDMQRALARFNDERRASDPLAVQLMMRVGINTGEVVAATGPADGRDFLVTGDPVNVAARLQSVADPGTVVVGPRTFRDTQGTVEYEALPPAELKGKPRAVRIWRAVRMLDANPVPLARARSLEPPRAPLIGRAVEMDLIASVYLRAVQQRRPRVVTILGAPGVGKTRLAREFIAKATQDTLAAQAQIGRCALYGDGIAFWPLAEILRDFCGITPATPPDEARALLAARVAEVLIAAGRRDDPATVALYLGYTIGLETVERQAKLATDTRTLQTDITRAWRGFWEALATVTPLVVMIDDLHWADDALLDLIEAIAARSHGAPIVFLCTARPELLIRRPAWGSGKHGFVSVALEPLLPDESSRLIDELLDGDALPVELRQSILRRADGNPFFIEEIVRMLIDRGVIVRADGRWQVAPDWAESGEADDPAIPDTVQGVLAARIDLLTPVERDILRHASVIGRTFWPSALMGITDHLTWEQLDEGLHSLIAKDLIMPATNPSQVDDPFQADEPRYLFKHPLTRDVVYEAMPRARRAHEHEHFAEWLETFAAGREVEYAELLARHYDEYYRQANLARSRDTERRRAVRAKIVRYLEMAGDEAMIRQATDAAVRAYTRAITLLLEDGEAAKTEFRDALVSLYAHRGDAKALRTNGDGAFDDYRVALGIWQASPTQEWTPAEDRANGMRLYRRLVTLPARYPSWFRVPPAPEELRGFLLAGLRLAEEAGDTDSLDYAALLTAKSFFWWSWPQGRGQEQIRDALASAEEAVAITERAGAAREASEALDALGNLQAAVTDLRGFLASQARRLFWAERIDDRNEIVDIHNEVSSAHQMVGEYGQAVEHARYALARAEELESDILRAHALQRLVVAYYEWDHWTSAINDGEQFMQVAARTPILTQNHYRWGVLAYAVALLRMGRVDRADKALQHLDDLPSSGAAQYVALFRARVQLARGNPVEAEPILRTALEIGAGRHSYPAVLAELAELGARLGRHDLTEAFGARAVNVGERSGARKPLAQALRARGLVALAEARYADAARDLDDALARYADLGTVWEEARTRYVRAELLRRQGETLAAVTEQLTLALRLFEQVGAVRDIARAKNALAGGEIRLP